MARIELLDESDIKGIMIDGYLPIFTTLKQRDWEKATEENLPLSPGFQEKFDKTFNRHLKQNRPIPNMRTQTKVYKELVGALRSRYCSQYHNPLAQFNSPADRIGSCAQFVFPGRGYGGVERHISLEGKDFKNKVLPAFYREIERESEEGKGNYFFNLTLLDLRDKKKCPCFGECTNNWIEFLDFKLKDEKDYVNYQEYKAAVETLLKNYITSAIEADWFGRKGQNIYLKPSG